MADLIMYALRTCPTCERARRDLTEEGVDFEERMIDDNPQWFDEASRLAPRLALIYQYRSNVAYLKGDTRAAVAALKKGLEIEPDNVLSSART